MRQTASAMTSMHSVFPDLVLGAALSPRGASQLSLERELREPNARHYPVKSSDDSFVTADIPADSFAPPGLPIFKRQTPRLADEFAI